MQEERKLQKQASLKNKYKSQNSIIEEEDKEEEEEGLVRMQVQFNSNSLEQELQVKIVEEMFELPADGEEV